MRYIFFSQSYKKKKHIIVSLMFSFFLITLGAQSFVSDLRNNGYSLIPAPQETILSGNDVKIDGAWGITSKPGIGNMAMKALIHGAWKLQNLEFAGTGDGKIILEISKGILNRKLNKELSDQGYHLEISKGLVKITGSSEEGLFYGVQSLLQLIRPSHGGTYTIPEGLITDWPDLQLRMVHWDTKHHQERMETLKRYLDQAAYFKINAIAFEIEDKYEYPSHPVIGAPGAYTKAEMHELCAYALERYIQIVPVIQAPSHMGYVLKHEEFVHLRADGNNYQACLCNEEAIQLIFDMYQDIIDATPGMNYFYVSTDELYYSGICGDCVKEYNDVNRSQAWVDYTNRAFEFVSDRDREVMAYVMYPLLMEDIPKLPSKLIAPVRDVEPPEWIAYLNETGIRQLAYTSMQGAEFLFPDYFRMDALKGRLTEAANTIPMTLESGAELMGVFGAAWDDAGLHSETFWLGWATVAQYAWSVNKPGIDQSTVDFMDSFYGYFSPDMVEPYYLLQEGARFYENLWELVISNERGPGYGSSRGKGIGVDRFDLTLQIPSLPTPGDIIVFPEFSKRYADKIEEASRLIKDNDKLIGLLQQSLSRVSQNRYNIELLLSLAYLERYTINTVLNLAELEELLLQARAGRLNFVSVVNYLVEAYKLVDEIQKEEEEMWTKFTSIWEKSRYPKCRSVDGKDFVHVFDDVKDHFADRRLGLEYMMAPFERLGLEEWQKELGTIIRDYAKAKNVPVKGFDIERLED
jgi:hexosaminidase